MAELMVSIYEALGGVPSIPEEGWWWFSTHYSVHFKFDLFGELLFALVDESTPK